MVVMNDRGRENLTCKIDQSIILTSKSINGVVTLPFCGNEDRNEEKLQSHHVKHMLGMNVEQALIWFLNVNKQRQVSLTGMVLRGLDTH